jgi:HEPN domain-containing protein
LSPEHREYAELLLQKARGELGAAQTLIATENYAAHVVGFLLQQTVEKALKSVLAARETEIPHTHDLEELVKLLASTGVSLRPALVEVDWLTPWGVTFRYDDPIVPLDADRGLEAATAAIGLAAQTLDEEETKS